ncbi:MAG TPA: glutathione S-transferase family protein [Alphaproteobacteria bacterium]|jgi:glutathione S-transferase|nr:glutathione S-transferase family protein [Alphaproteobacteria bacterium]
MSLTFYYAPRTCALATRIALEEAGADFDVVRVDFAKGGQREPDYLKVNPKGRVPALATERGILTETPAILAFIAQTHPAAQLMPLDDPFAFAEAQAFNGYVSSTLHVAHAHGPRGSRWADDPAAIAEMKRVVPRTVAECFAMIEDRMLKGPWVLGGSYSVCDAYLFTVAGWMEADQVDPARFPKVLDHRNRVGERAATKRALAADV